jgi:D-amino-acid dehydrogenase
MNKNVIVIGGGIIGLFTAYYIQKEGHKVTIIDKTDLSKGASNVNAGFISPSHFIPLASPGVISQGLKMMLDKNSPFYIKPRLEKELIQWLWAFKNSANIKKVNNAIPTFKNLILFSSDLFFDLKLNDNFDFHFENKGMLTLYKTEKYALLESKIAQRAISEGLNVQILSSDQVRLIEPEISLDVIGAVHYKNDSHSTPKSFIQNFKKYLIDKGVQFYLNEKVESIDSNINTITKIKTNNRIFKPDEVVFATGSWTSKILKQLGIKLLLQAGKGYNIDIYKPTGIKLPAILSEAKVAVSPMQNYTRLAGTMEIDKINNKISKNRVLSIANLAKTYYKELNVSENNIKKAEFGLRPVSPDGLPYIGRLSKFKNATIATGHAMMGWTLAPGTGKIVSEIISNKNPTINLDLFNPERVF